MLEPGSTVDSNRLRDVLAGGGQHGPARQYRAAYSPGPGGSVDTSGPILVAVPPAEMSRFPDRRVVVIAVVVEPHHFPLVVQRRVQRPAQEVVVSVRRGHLITGPVDSEAVNAERNRHADHWGL